MVIPPKCYAKPIQPLFQDKKGADRDETNFFSPELKRLAEAYFAADDNARDFDADWILGMQDWSGLTPSFSTFILDERRARVISLSPSSPVTCLFISSMVTSAMISRSRGVSDSNNPRSSASAWSLSRRFRSRSIACDRTGGRNHADVCGVDFAG
jgi:hypothetical protein